MLARSASPTTSVGGSEIARRDAASTELRRDEDRDPAPRSAACPMPAASRATGSPWGTAVALSARRSSAVAASSACPVRARSDARRGGEHLRREELVEARIERAAFGAGERRRLAVVRREDRGDDARGVLFAAELVDRDHRLEERRREASRRERAARVARGAIEQDVHGRRLLVADVELGERAQDADVARELAPRGLERLLGLAQIAARVLVDRRRARRAACASRRGRRLAREARPGSRGRAPRRSASCRRRRDARARATSSGARLRTSRRATSARGRFERWSA